MVQLHELAHDRGGGGWMFLGTYTPRLDDKGRLALPARFRTDLEGGLVITKGHARCLFGFPLAEFGRVSEQLRNRTGAGGALQDYTRVFFASASQEIPDAQGRVTVPGNLRDYAALSKDCVVIGHDTRFEIWDAQAWQDYLERAEQPFAEGLEAPAWM